MDTCEFSWDLSWGILEGLRTGRISLRGHPCGDLVGTLVGFHMRPLVGQTSLLCAKKSTLWTDASADQNFQRDLDQSLGALFSWKSVWTNAPENLSKVSPRQALVHGWLFPFVCRAHVWVC